MCSIAGVIGFEKTKFYEVLVRDQHRGPDGCGKRLFDDDFIIGHNRLAIIDTSDEGRQPMESDRYVLSVNGEIYNYKDLANITGNDSKTLLAYFERHGIDKTLRDINGMYAIALYDKHEERLHLITDRFAQKPLYYHSMWQHGAPHFAFASSPAALTSLVPSVRIDPEALQTYWLLGSVMGDKSIFEGIRKVPGATHLTYDTMTGKMDTEVYWTPQYRANHDDIEDLVLDAIRTVQVADVPVFLFLSGGIDSTLCASQMEGKEAVHLESPERIWAEEVARKYRMNLRHVGSELIDVEACLEDYFYKCGEPSAAALIPYITAREASKFCKVAICANGADELFFGYNRTHDQIRRPQHENIFRMGCAGDLGLDDLVPSLAKLDDRLSPGRWLELKTFVECDLNKTLDFASMAHGLEMRSPFLDHRLVELALSIPEEFHRSSEHGFESKAILKEMLFKMGFSVPFITREKIGFSLHSEPLKLSVMKAKAFRWCIDEGFLTVDESKLNKRDSMYLQSAAIGFKKFHDVWMK